MALSAGVVVPNVLRWYWWRMNGIGYAAATFLGVVLSAVSLIRPQTPVYLVFPLICGASLVAGIAASLATRPVDGETLVKFYRSVRPFGWWGPVRKAAEVHKRDRSESLGLTALNTVLGMGAILGLYLAPMYLVGHWYAKAGFWAALTAGCVVILKFTWYNHLPEADPAA